MGACLACCSPSLQPGVEVNDLQVLPPPEDAPRPIGNPPKMPNVAFELRGRCSRVDFINAFAEIFAHTLVKPGDGVNQTAGFESQKYGKQFSHGCVIQELSPPVQLVVSMNAGANYWVHQIVGNIAPIGRGAAVIVEVTETAPNQTKVRVIGRWDGPIPARLVRYLWQTALYGKIMRQAELIAKK